MSKIYFLLLSILVFSGCNDTSEIGLLDSDLMGTWDWTNTDGGFAAHIHETPETTGKTIQLILSESWDYKVIENNVEVSSGEYTLSKKESIYSVEMELFITLKGNYSLQNVVLNGIVGLEGDNILSISDNYYDGIGSRFERAN